MPPFIYPGQCTLAERFRQLIREGMTPEVAVDRLRRLFYARHFHLVEELPEGHFTFGIDADAKLVIELDGQQLDPEKIMTRPPHGLEACPGPLDNDWMSIDPKQEARDALARVLMDAPPPPPTKEKKISDQAIAAAKAMKRAGEIPKGISQVKLAEALAGRIGKPDSEEYIRTRLTKWGIRPPPRPKRRG